MGKKRGRRQRQHDPGRDAADGLEEIVAVKISAQGRLTGDDAIPNNRARKHE